MPKHRVLPLTRNQVRITETTRITGKTLCEQKPDYLQNHIFGIYFETETPKHTNGCHTFCEYG